jgi:hypothetical protein
MGQSAWSMGQRKTNSEVGMRKVENDDPIRVCCTRVQVITIIFEVNLQQVKEWFENFRLPHL